jgi:hypothetical protein
MQFIIEQIAVAPANPSLAKQLLAEIGAHQWHEDNVVAVGEVFGQPGRNIANLSFNYQLGIPVPNAAKALEFEVLEYTTGPNWVEQGKRLNSVCHVGMHCTEEELEQWFKFFEDRGIPVAQEVFTESHTNPNIAGKRWYNYVIFDTRALIGVDLKFIVRREQPGSADT